MCPGVVLEVLEEGDTKTIDEGPTNPSVVPIHDRILTRRCGTMSSRFKIRQCGPVTARFKIAHSLSPLFKFKALLKSMSTLVPNKQCAMTIIGPGFKEDEFGGNAMKVPFTKRMNRVSLHILNGIHFIPCMRFMYLFKRALCSFST